MTRRPDRLGEPRPLPNPAFAERTRASAAKPVVADLFGFVLDEVAPGAVTMRVDLRPELGHAPGWFQGGVVSALAEFAASYAASTLIPAAWINMTLEQSIKFVDSARGERLRARGRVLKGGRTISTTAADVFVVREGEEHLCAVMLQTCHHAPPRDRTP